VLSSRTAATRVTAGDSREDTITGAPVGSSSRPTAADASTGGDGGTATAACTASSTAGGDGGTATGSSPGGNGGTDMAARSAANSGSPHPTIPDMSAPVESAASTAARTAATRFCAVSSSRAGGSAVHT